MNSDDEMQEIDKITKEDIFRLLNIATDIDNTFKMDEYDFSLTYANAWTVDMNFISPSQQS